MQVFRNKGFTKRNYDCTNIAACSIIPQGTYGFEDGTKVPANYEPADETLIEKMTPLRIEGGVRYWGWL